MTEAEKERAKLSRKDEYSNDMPCAVCGYRWMQHHGTLCPKVPGHFSRILGAVPPRMGDTTFIPDVNYYKTPNFDVV